MLPQGDLFTVVDQLSDYEKTLRAASPREFQAYGLTASKDNQLWRIYCKVRRTR